MATKDKWSDWTPINGQYVRIMIQSKKNGGQVLIEAKNDLGEEVAFKVNGEINALVMNKKVTVKLEWLDSLTHLT